MRKGKGDLIFSFILWTFGLFIIIDSYRLGLQTFSKPGPGLFPFLLGILLCILTLPLCINSLRSLMTVNIVTKNLVTAPKGNIKQFGVVVAFLIGYFFLLDLLGFLVDTFLFLFGLFYMGYPRKLLRVTILSLLVAALVYLIFNTLLQVQFPLGFINIG